MHQRSVVDPHDIISLPSGSGYERKRGPKGPAVQLTCLPSRHAEHRTLLVPTVWKARCPDQRGVAQCPWLDTAEDRFDDLGREIADTRKGNRIITTITELGCSLIE